MKRNLSKADIEARFAQINSQEPEDLTNEETASLATAQAMDDGSSVNLEDYKAQHEYSGKLMLRIPKELHETLAITAKENGVSLNQYMLYKLAKGENHHELR